jgi:hypothetical protein
MKKVSCILTTGFILVHSFTSGQFVLPAHKKTDKDAVAVTRPGSYGTPGTVYILANDLTSPQSAVFLGKDVTLDLNGYTIKYADGNYKHIDNSGFEQGDKGWDLSKAPGAKVVNTQDVHVFVGRKIMSLKKDDEITSSYINLPISDRSYFAMCGVTGFDYHAMGANMANQMKISIYVEDEQGREVKSITKYEDTTLVSCPLEKAAPELGGGFLYAHLNHLPAGKYRVRIKADTDCLVDEIDIRPAMDAGIGVVENTSAKGHYYHLYHCGHTTAFFDYTENIIKGIPVSSIPLVKGTGTITIKNGIIESGTEGILSWGIQSTSENVRIILDNVKIKTSGINAAAVEVPQATITDCRFEVENPFIINRHCSFSAVNLRGTEPSEISFSEFYGGQGCLFTEGKKTSIHHNLFVNRQTVTNHYSVGANGEGTRIFENRIEPETGSGVWPSQNCEIFNNVFRIKTSPPTCEYGHEEYSTNAIRMADYHRKPGAADGTFGNKVYNNKIYITAKDYPAHPDYIPMSFAIFYSVAGGEDDVFGNDIVLEKTDPASKSIITGFYICGGTESLGGNFCNNRITTSVPAVWLASMYGGAANTKICNNTIIKAAGANSNFKPFRMGWAKRDVSVAKNIQFRSNEFQGFPFDMDITDQDHSYSVYWTLQVKISDKNSNPVKDAEVIIMDKEGKMIVSKKTGKDGYLKEELLEYSVDGPVKIYSSPYTVITGKLKKQVILDKNSQVELQIKR